MKLFPSSRLATLLSLVILSPSSVGLLGAAPSLTTFTVTNTNDSGAGSLRQAILDANATPERNEIVFRLSGSGMKTITLTSGQLEISDQLFISGLGRNKLTISGNQASRIFQINDGVNVAMSGVTIADGDNRFGGAILNRGSLEIHNSAFRNNHSLNGGAILNGQENRAAALTVDNVQFTSNRGSLGGAINNYGTAIIRHSTFSNNVSDSSGAGIFNQISCTLRVEESTFNNNQGDDGGSIATGGQLTVRKSIFKDNQATAGGGISASNSANTVVEDSNFSGNTAREGGGIYNAATLTVNDSNFTSNLATIHGGGIYNESVATVSYGSFKSNSAGDKGGGIYTVTMFSTSQLKLEFSTLENNSAGNGGGIFSGDRSASLLKSNLIRRNTATIANPDLSGALISNGSNEIGNATGSTGFVNGVLGDRIGSNPAP